MKLLLKGVDNCEDARLARKHGVDGVIVSNHGGRAAETLRSTIECLPEVVDAAGSQIPVLVDGGFRRGTDVFKALALGARESVLGGPTSTVYQRLDRRVSSRSSTFSALS
jgi:isopentenyl diphosphate isomerase/L-lactate dehydrogenase-like FMN-dependent dehydrogenase